MIANCDFSQKKSYFPQLTSSHLGFDGFSCLIRAECMLEHVIDYNSATVMKYDALK